MKAKLLSYTSALCLSLAFVLPLKAQETPVQPLATAQTERGYDAGAYLAARSSEFSGDFQQAAAWYVQAHLADPEKPELLEGAIFSLLNLGDVKAAAEMATRLMALPSTGTPSQLAAHAILASQALSGDYVAIVASAEQERALSPILDGLSLAWAQFGQGHMSEALALFGKVAQTRGFEAYGLVHKALAFAAAGDFENADAILAGRVQGRPLQLNRRAIIAHAQILSQLERQDDALALLDRTFGPESEPTVDLLRDKLRAGETLPFDMVRDAKDGIAEAFFSIATLLNGEADPAYTLLNARLAAALRPDHVEAVLLSAAMFENLGQYDLAEQSYTAFGPDHPSYYSAQLGRSDALYKAGRKEESVATLQKLVEDFPDLALVQAALGDRLRMEERWQDAITAYDRALALLPQDDRGLWLLYFSRGICHERLKEFDKSDDNFRKALAINSKEASILNYLGYSLIDRGVQLEEGLTLIQSAVKLQPEAGYIIDSLAWAHFKLGQYEKALEPMEKASVLEPVDPVVTDHLGDVYWMNGRQREAQFQWHRALSFNPDAETAQRIRQKLDVGLDAVLAQETQAKTAGN